MVKKKKGLFKFDDEKVIRSLGLKAKPIKITKPKTIIIKVKVSKPESKSRRKKFKGFF